MNKSLLSTAVAAVIGTVSLTAQAALTSSTVLAFDDGQMGCLYGGTFPDSCLGGTTAVTITSGSFFTMGDPNAVGAKTGLFTTSGSTQSDKGAGLGMHEVIPTVAGVDYHNGGSTGNEAGPIDVWDFYYSTGAHFLTSPMLDTGVDGNGNHLIDMSGWRVSWNTSIINMGGDPANAPGDTSLGIMQCSTSSCSQSSSFTLDYAAHVPLDDPNTPQDESAGFPGVPYALHMTGTVGFNVAHVPVPAAFWLFGSGLVGLAGVARRKKA